MAPTAACKFGANCARRSTCTFKHPDEEKKKAPCKFGDKCRNGNSCPFAHCEPEAPSVSEEEDMNDEVYLAFMAFEDEMIEAELAETFAAEIAQLLEESDDEDDEDGDWCEPQGERDETADTLVVF